MEFFQGLVDSVGSVCSASSSAYQSQGNPSNSSSSTWEEYVELRCQERELRISLKGYFDLAKGQIDKAEEWGLASDAITHYKNAQRILIEASSTPVPSFISSSEQEKVQAYRQKISKWQGQVSDRLQALTRRTGGTSTSKAGLRRQSRL